MTPRDQGTAYDVGPLEPFNERTRIRAEISRRQRAKFNIIRSAQDNEQLFDACDGDFYDVIYAAVVRHIKSGKYHPPAPRCKATTIRGEPCQRFARADGYCPAHIAISKPDAAGIDFDAIESVVTETLVSHGKRTFMLDPNAEDLDAEVERAVRVLWPDLATI